MKLLGIKILLLFNSVNGTERRYRRNFLLQSKINDNYGTQSVLINEYFTNDCRRYIYKKERNRINEKMCALLNDMRMLHADNLKNYFIKQLLNQIDCKRNNKRKHRDLFFFEIAHWKGTFKSLLSQLTENQIKECIAIIKLKRKKCIEECYLNWIIKKETYSNAKILKIHSDEFLVNLFLKNCKFKIVKILIMFLTKDEYSFNSMLRIFTLWEYELIIMKIYEMYKGNFELTFFMTVFVYAISSRFNNLFVGSLLGICCVDDEESEFIKFTYLNSEDNLLNISDNIVYSKEYIINTAIFLLRKFNTVEDFKSDNIKNVIWNLKENGFLNGTKNTYNENIIFLMKQAEEFLNKFH